MAEKDSIFILQAGTDIKEIEQAPYDKEKVLQLLIKEHPVLLAGAKIDGEKPLRLLLVGREVGVPDVEGGSNRWSLDHLFLDHEAIPTLVEVKRSSDSRVRREVVGQMLDYAANAQTYWPLEKIKGLAEKQAGGPEILLDAIADLLEIEPDENRDERVGKFWDDVENNLHMGNVRLLFVADKIPYELRRIIEFLNEQTPRVHVVGLEIVQYKRDELRVLVPRVVGQTEAARRKRGRAPKTDKDEFLQSCSPEARAFFAAFLGEAESRGLVIYWGEKGFSVSSTDKRHDRKTTFLYGYPPGTHFDESSFEVYIHESAFSDQESKEIRKRILSCGPFRESGKYTLRLPLTPESIDTARRALDEMWKLENEIRR